MTPILEFDTWWRISLVPLCLIYLSGFVFSFVSSFVNTYLITIGQRDSGLNSGFSVWSLIPIFFQWLFLVAFAVSWHRLVLLNPDKSNVRKSIGIDIGGREAAFFGIALIYVAVLMGPYYLVTIPDSHRYLNSLSIGPFLVIFFSLWPIFCSPFCCSSIISISSSCNRSPYHSWPILENDSWTRLAGAGNCYSVRPANGNIEQCNYITACHPRPGNRGGAYPRGAYLVDLYFHADGYCSNCIIDDLSLDR